MTTPQRLVISSVTTGLQTYEKPFFLNNDAFPVLQNAILFRKSAQKKAGAQRLGQLQRNIGTTGASPFTATLAPIPLSHGTSKFVIGSVVLLDTNTSGTASVSLVCATAGYSGTLNRTTGALSISFPVIGATPVQFFPATPSLGIESFESDKSPNTQIDFPINVFFDQNYSYQYDGANFFDVSFYKITNNPVYWTGASYQQFFSCNYYRAMWATNNKPGMQFESIATITAANPTVITTSANHGLSTGDYVFFNEVTGTDSNLLNGVSAQITKTGNTSFTVPINTATKSINNAGIFQTLTVLSPTSSGDGLRWYDGNSPGVLGWVNFAPPLDNLYSSSTTYLMGARMILPFGNRLLAIGTYEATSANAASPTYYGNRIRYCEVSATPFYSSPVPNTVSSTAIEPLSWASNIQGYGGFIDLDTTDRIISAAVTQGSLILGLESEQRRMSNTGIETDPFSFDVINPEYGTAGTFAITPMDKGILSVGEYGFLETSSYDSHRIDEKIIDQIFQINQSNNGYDKISGARDFVNEVIYFSYYSDEADPHNSFPDTTVVYNYRESSFAIWKESFTTYGLYKNSTADTWATYFIPWESWTTAWQDLGSDRYSKPYVAAGTPQGYVMIKWSDLSFNQASIQIQDISVNADGETYTVTSPNHNLSQGMYLGFWNGPPSSSEGRQSFNGSVVSVSSNSQFVVAFASGATPSSIVAGVWEISIVDQFDIYTKQFQLAWSANMKTRIGAQKYFLDRTGTGEFTVNIYGSQSYVPLNNENQSPSVISSNVVRTRPDDSLGLNDNAISQDQLWHRLACSAIGDTVQLEFTLSDKQMLDVSISTAPWVFYSAVLDLYPSRVLA